jgi:hypothetical protein
VAFFQVAYAGWAVFRIERLEEARARDARLGAMGKADVVASLARTAAALVLFTLLYGVATIALSGLRGGFWLFPVMALAQAGWYYREIGQIAAWQNLQPDDAVAARAATWRHEPPDYCPPITRGLVARQMPSPPND